MAREVVGEEVLYHVEKMNKGELAAVHFKDERLDFVLFEGDVGNGFEMVALGVESGNAVGKVGYVIFIVNGGLADVVMG